MNPLTEILESLEHLCSCCTGPGKSKTAQARRFDLPIVQRFKKIAATTAIAGVAVLVFGFGCYAAGARVNTTPSLPVGLYWTTTGPIEKGAYVMFCPPKRAIFDVAKMRGYIGGGFCNGGYGYMMKRVLAAKNDAVTVADDGVRVNDVLLPYTAPLKNDSAGRLMPHYRIDAFRLQASQVLLMSDVCTSSFDSRYFGPIERRQIQWAIRPIFTW